MKATKSTPTSNQLTLPMYHSNQNNPNFFKAKRNKWRYSLAKYINLEAIFIKHAARLALPEDAIKYLYRVCMDEMIGELQKQYGITINGLGTLRVRRYILHRWGIKYKSYSTSLRLSNSGIARMRVYDIRNKTDFNEARSDSTEDCWTLF